MRTNVYGRKTSIYQLLSTKQNKLTEHKAVKRHNLNAPTLSWGHLNSWQPHLDINGTNEVIYLYMVNEINSFASAIFFFGNT